MTAADKRVEELLDRWLASLELHARYAKLDDAAYARAEQWPQHQRPTRWIIDVARQRLAELRSHLAQRKDAGDPTFAEALELMSFLTSLLGSEHVERYIPTATGRAPDAASVTTAVEQPAAPRRPAAQPKQVAASKPSSPTPRPVAQKSAKNSAPPVPSAHEKSGQVIADAVRMLEWGREWPALAGLIARMADRPPEAEVWKILRAHRTEILAKARRTAG